MTLDRYCCCGGVALTVGPIPSGVNVRCFYYFSVRSLSLGAPFWYVFYYQWCYLLVSCMRNITPGESDAGVVGTNRRQKRTMCPSEITKNTVKPYIIGSIIPSKDSLSVKIGK